MKSKLPARGPQCRLLYTIQLRAQAPETAILNWIVQQERTWWIFEPSQCFRWLPRRTRRRRAAWRIQRTTWRSGWRGSIGDRHWRWSGTLVLELLICILLYSLSFEQYKYPLLILDFSLLVTKPFFFEYLSASCTLENIAILRHSNFTPPSSNTSIL